MDDGFRATASRLEVPLGLAGSGILAVDCTEYVNDGTGGDYMESVQVSLSLQQQKGLQGLH